MTVEIRNTAGGNPTTYQYVTALVMDENRISLIQETDAERTSRTFEVGYSATVIK